MSDGELLTAGANAVWEQGRDAVAELFDDCVVQPGDYDAEIRLLGSFIAAGGGHLDVMTKLADVIKDESQPLETRAACLNVIGSRVYFRSQHYYDIVHDVVDFLIHNSDLQPELGTLPARIKQACFGEAPESRMKRVVVSHAKACLDWLDRRAQVLMQHRTGQIVVDPECVTTLLDRAEFRDRGFGEGHKHVKQLTELVLATAERGFQRSRSTCLAKGFWPFKAAANDAPMDGMETYFTVGELRCPIRYWSGMLGCVWDETATDRFRLRDALVING